MERPYVLVVDDNKITTKLMRRYLETNGFEAEEAYDGMECLEKVAVRQPSCIVLDVMMPRLDGFETVKILKHDVSTAQIPVVIVTALNDMATQVRAVEAGADDFLTKPVEEKLLVAKATVLTALATERARTTQLQNVVALLLDGRTDEAREALAQIPSASSSSSAS